MSRTANVLLAMAVVFLTSAVVIYYAPVPAGDMTPDVRPLVAIGGVLAVLVYVVDARWFRHLIEHGPFRTTAHRFSELVRKGMALSGAVEDAARLGGPLPDALLDQIEEWANRADELVRSRTNQHVLYLQGLGLLNRGPRDEALQFLSGRILKLNALLLNVAD